MTIKFAKNCTYQWYPGILTNCYFYYMGTVVVTIYSVVRVNLVKKYWTYMFLLKYELGIVPPTRIKICVINAKVVMIRFSYCEFLNLLLNYIALGPLCVKCKIVILRVCFSTWLELNYLYMTHSIYMISNLIVTDFTVVLD